MPWWIEILVANRSTIALIAVSLLTALRPILIANGFPEAVIDQLIALLGNLTVAVVRSTMPMTTKGYTYTASGGGALVAGAGLAGLISPEAALTTSAIAFGLSGIGFNDALKRGMYHLHRDAR